jgi:hypothetical protein
MNTVLALVSAPSTSPRAQATARQGAAGLGGTWCLEGQCYRGIVWGPESWFDPAVGKLLRQDLDFFPVVRGQRATPLILYIHPSRDTKTIHPGRRLLYDRLVQEARAWGFSVASVEYRHPGLDDLIDATPDNDIAAARRWLHAHAGPLGIDAGNVFIVDQSRGTLGLRTALQHRHDPAVRVNAAYSHHERTTFRGLEVARRFVAESDGLGFVDRIAPERAYDGVIPFFQRYLRA